MALYRLITAWKVFYMLKMSPLNLMGFLWIWGWVSLCCLAESPIKTLTPKSKTAPQKTIGVSPKKLQPKVVEAPLPISTLESVSFSALLGTPLIHENFNEKRFAALTQHFLFSIPIQRLDPSLFLHFETGPGFSFARLTFESPPLSYTHLFLLVPAHVRLIYSISKSFHLEAYSGIMLRAVEYDSRDTTDGGTRWVKGSDLLNADGGLGFDYNISSPLKIRALVGYQFLLAGMELTL